MAFHLRARNILLWFGILLLIVACAVGFGMMRIATMVAAPNFALRAGNMLTGALGRPVQLGQAEITWGNPLRLAMHDIHIANADWGSEPDLMRIGALTADIELVPLLQGRLQYRHLTARDVDILLERNKDGMGNWNFSGTKKTAAQPPTNGPAHLLNGPAHLLNGPAQPNGGLALIPKNRTQFPVLLDMEVRRGAVRLRTSSGKVLRMAADDLKMYSAGDDQPVHLIWDGSYNHIPARLSADMQSYADMRRAELPYGMHVMIEMQHSRLDFKGTMMNWLDADGAQGQMQITSSAMGEILQMMGMNQPSNLHLEITGPFTRDGDHWRWQQTQDHLADNDFNGDLALDEGPRGGQDHINLNLAGQKFDLKSVWAGISAGPKMQASGFKDETNLFLSLRLAAQDLYYGSIHVFDAVMRAGIQPNQIALGPSEFTWAGGRANFNGQMIGTAQQLKFNLSANVTNGDFVKLAPSLGIGNMMGGTFNMAAELTMSGKILDQALRHNSQGGMVFSMNNGWVQKSLIEKSSLNLKTLFRHNDGNTHIVCVLGIADIHNGSGKIAPLRMVTQDGSLRGGGKVDFYQQRLNMTVQSDPSTTGFFALDIPISISGPFDDISIAPAFGTTVTKQTAVPSDLPDSLTQLAMQNNCTK